MSIKFQITIEPHADTRWLAGRSDLREKSRTLIESVVKCWSTGPLPSVRIIDDEVFHTDPDTGKGGLHVRSNQVKDQRESESVQSRRGLMAGSSPRRFYWSQSYELDDKVHWALHDTLTDSEGPPSRVTCGTLILEAHSPNYFGRPLDQEWWPKKIVALLNEHFQMRYTLDVRARRVERAAEMSRIRRKGGRNTKRVARSSNAKALPRGGAERTSNETQD